jgi:hypothetical protein
MKKQILNLGEIIEKKEQQEINGGYGGYGGGSTMNQCCGYQINYTVQNGVSCDVAKQASWIHGGTWFYNNYYSSSC